MKSAALFGESGTAEKCGSRRRAASCHAETARLYMLIAF